VARITSDMTEDAASLKIFVAVAGPAAIMHAFLLRWGVFPANRADPSASFASNPYVNSGFVLLSALLYGVLLSKLVRTAVRQRMITAGFLLKAGVRATLATVVALQVRYLAMGALLAYQSLHELPRTQGPSLGVSFLISMFPVETYGLIEIMFSILPAFGLGLLLTGLVAWSFQRALALQ
jgi:hypothetical protein